MMTSKILLLLFGLITLTSLETRAHNPWEEEYESESSFDCFTEEEREVFMTLELKGKQGMLKTFHYGEEQEYIGGYTAKTRYFRAFYLMIAFQSHVKSIQQKRPLYSLQINGFGRGAYSKYLSGTLVKAGDFRQMGYQIKIHCVQKIK